MTVERARRRGGWSQRLFRLATFVGVQGVAFVVLLELVGRVVDPLGISFYPESARYFDHFILEDPIGYRNRPGLAGRFWGEPVTINALGMRDREVGPKAAGEFRILMLGDSIPFGVGVTYEDSIPARLERLLDAAYRGRPRFRTLNMGVPSYNTEQELIQLRSVGLGLEPDLAVLVYTLNDIEPKMWILDKRKSWIVDVSQRSYAACLVTVLARRVRTGLGVPNDLIAAGNYRPDHPRFAAVDAALTEIHRLCREAGVSFVLFTSFGAEEHPAYRMVEAIGRREGFAVLSASPWDDPRWASRPRLPLQNSATDAHPNPEGSEAYATRILDGLRAAGVLPPAEPAPSGEGPAGR